jgi:type IV secretory pathway VirB10-like protein
MSQSRSTTRIRISLASGAGAQRSPFGIIAAVAIHAVVIIATLFTWQHRLDITEESPPMIPVDLVTIAQKTNIAPAAPKIVREKPVPQFQPEQLVQKPPPVVQPSEVAPAPVAPKTKPQPKPDTKKSLDKQMADLLNNVLTSAPRTAPQANLAQPARKGIGQQNAMTMDLADALRNQIEQCWNPPAGAPHPEQLVVYVDLWLNPDGSVARSPQLAAQSSSAVADNSFMRAAADAAMRAIYVCAPFKLPADRYADWRESTVKFDPRDLAGQ